MSIFIVAPAAERGASGGVSERETASRRHPHGWAGRLGRMTPPSLAGRGLAVSRSLPQPLAPPVSVADASGSCSRQDLLDDFAVHVGQAVMAPLELERQALVVDPQQVQD